MCIKVKEVKVKKLLDRIKAEYNNFNIDEKKIKLDQDVYLNEYQIESIISVIKKFILDIDINFAEVVFQDIFKKPNIEENGKIYEVLLYGWLIENMIKFTPQPKIGVEECLKKNEYEADGKILNVIFDVKSFGFGFTHIETLRKKIYYKLEQKYIINIGGSKNTSDKDLSEYALKNIDKIVSELQNDKNKFYKDYIYNIKELNLEIRATPIEEGISTSISEFDPYKCAEENQFFFMKNASQFCVKSPYIIFCPFDSNRNYLMKKNDSRNIMLRALCRRIFMNLKNMNDKKVSEFDGKAKDDITIDIASKKISAIIFLDVSEKSTYGKCDMRIYINPNADNKLPKYQIDAWFRQKGASIEDFEYDNY